ncbi:MAG: tryptophan synthase subunit alpha [Gammaproteobacteria bacterium]|nr:MAG: tryptophan synthase subunit alpha [Gammaproteobacteria bacterium]
MSTIADSRIKGCFEKLRQQGKKALISYITAGDPTPEITVEALHELVAGGVDVLEIGVPFSDPVADGEVIQRACERALEHNVSLSDVLEMVKQFRSKDDITPIVLMGYLNPIEVIGYQDFAKLAKAAGVDGVISVDMTPEESEEYNAALATNKLDPIYLITPTSSKQRVEWIASMASGFIYYVSVKGVTGSSKLDVKQVSEKLDIIREITDLPIGVGFGIKDAESAAMIASVADAAIVGSALVKIHAQNVDDPAQIPGKLKDLVLGMRTAIDS